MKKWLWSAVWLLAGLAIIVVLIAAMQKNKNQQCSKIEVNILSNHEQMFLTEQNILDLIDAKSIVNKKTVGEVDVKNIEQLIEKNVWIQNVEVYFDKNAILHIDVQERMPLFRIFRQNGVSFYMDKKYFVLPLSTTYSAKVPVITGFNNNVIFNNKDSIALESINKMATYINNNDFWMAQTQELHLVNNDEFEIIPSIGNHTILFGDTIDMENKFSKLLKFYKSVSSQIGFDKYEVLDIQFKNQIIATLKGKSTLVDTAKANQTIQDFMQASMDTSFITIDTASTRPKSTDTARSNNNIVVPNTASRVVTPKPKTTISGNITPAKMPKKRPQTIINKPPRTITHRAIMPKKPIVKRSNNPSHSQH